MLRLLCTLSKPENIYDAIEFDLYKHYIDRDAYEDEDLNNDVEEDDDEEFTIILPVSVGRVT